MNVNRIVAWDPMFTYCKKASQVYVFSRPCLHLPEIISRVTFLPGTKHFQLWFVTYILIGLSLIRQSKGLPSQSTSVSLHSN